jgi:outer membrane protein assembly factor BamB
LKTNNRHHYLRGITLLIVLLVSNAEALIACGTEIEPLAALNNNGGLCVHLGVSDGRLTAKLNANGKYAVHGLASNKSALEKSRKYLIGKGLYGPVSVALARSGKLPYAENLVNAVLLENPSDFPQLLLPEVMRILTPNGIFFFKGPLSSKDIIAAGFVMLPKKGAWSQARKPWPPGISDWPSFDYGPHGNPVSADTTVGPGTHLRWRIPMYSRHCRGIFSGWLSASGRMFYVRHKILDDSFRTSITLVARDAFNGQLLWQQPAGWMIGAKYGDRNVLASKERLYLPLEIKGPVVALDACNGRQLLTFQGSNGASQILLVKNMMIGSNWSSSWACDLKSGRQLWSSKIGGQFVFAEGQLLFANVYGKPRKIVSLNPDNGKQNWQAPGGNSNLYNQPFYYKRMLIVVNRAASKTNRYGVSIKAYAISEKGKLAWSFEPEKILRRGGCYMAEVFGAAGQIWVHASVKPDPAKKNAGRYPSAWLGLDPLSGKINKRFDDKTSDAGFSKMLKNGTHRCNRGRATERGYLFGTNEFYEWKSGLYLGSSATRSTCGIGVGMLPANGLVYAPPPTCVCRKFMQRGGFSAFASNPDGVKTDENKRLLKGPGRAGTSRLTPEDWPIYRKNPARLGATTTGLPDGIKLLWQKQLSPGLSPPTVAAGRVLVASSINHRVNALEASSGKMLWSYTAGGRIDSSPTISAGRVIFGCRDGWVYCLSASSGKLIWKFRLAPREERILIDGQLESPWPVHGSVLVVNNMVYAAAGWHTALDGGVTLGALALAGGQPLWVKRHQRLPGDYGVKDVPISLLSSDGQTLMMGSKVFALTTGAEIKASQAARVISFGLSSFLDNDWVRSSNSKGRLRWDDGRARGELLCSGPDFTCGLDITLQGRDDGSLLGIGSHKLFASKKRGQNLWSLAVPLVPRAAVLAGANFYVAGRPDPELPELKGLKDKRRRRKLGAELMAKRNLPKNGELWVLSAKDGTKSQVIPLPTPPVFDGMAVTGGRLYLTTLDGVLHCFGRK